MADIQLATTDAAIDACFPVMVQLRPQLNRTDFVARIRTQMQSGYHLAFLAQQGTVTTVAGFRLGESLSWGRYMYVDDLVTDIAHRSRGFGAKMLAWLTAYARDHGCEQFHLDSGLARTDAHRFYQLEGLPAVAYHFAKALN